MIEIIEEIRSNLDFSSFLFVVFLYFVSFGISKRKHLLARFEDPSENKHLPDDQTYVLDKILFGIGLLVMVYLIIFSQLDPILEFLRSYDILNFSLIVISMLIIFSLVFLKKVLKSTETDKSISHILATCITEFFVLVFYASFSALVFPVILFALTGSHFF